ncbi:hematopoietically-expressed homeobox protein HHEX-like [Colias croceus]|uniref:hematopoietically-expressed homeobox protein HHEX-like n=1 Tax=Colias crocea TaxID=72248 RepID=UPI001E28104E|nr:hematopoietically-expressed homeobox protein HHEX-like [Colias croceus]
MEQIFKTRPYICREERLALTEKLQVCEKSIKVWFQNRRRISEKREKLYIPDSPSSIDTCDSNCDRLAYIESQINERVDAHGNVALDDHVITELARIIDDYLSQQAETLIIPTPMENDKCIPNANLEDTYTESYENHPIYEPISPASVVDEFLL